MNKDAAAAIQKAKDIILENIPDDQIISIYIKGSYVQNEMGPDSDVDLVVILKDEAYLQSVYDLTERYGNTTHPPFQTVAYTLKELQTGKKELSRLKKATAVSRFVKHMDLLPIIFGQKPPGPLFTRTDKKDLDMNIQNFNAIYLPEYKEGKFSFSSLVKQVFWLVEAEQRAKGLNPGYSWKKLAEAEADKDHIIHLALAYRRRSDVSDKEKEKFVKELEEYLKTL